MDGESAKDDSQIEEEEYYDEESYDSEADPKQIAFRTKGANPQLDMIEDLAKQVKTQKD